MGWSCDARAGEMMERIFSLREDKTHNGGVSGTWKAGGQTYFFEVSNVEHEDGAITGAVYVFVEVDRCREVGRVRIEPDGTLSTAPAHLRAALERARMEREGPARRPGGPDPKGNPAGTLYRTTGGIVGRMVERHGSRYLFEQLGGGRVWVRGPVFVVHGDPVEITRTGGPANTIPATAPPSSSPGGSP